MARLNLNVDCCLVLCAYSQRLAPPDCLIVSPLSPHPAQIYWMHRTLHTNKFLYKYVHALHHKYNSAETLSPWASIAFNPLDGVLQVTDGMLGRKVCGPSSEKDPFGAVKHARHALFRGTKDALW